ncbi:MAG: ABC transporter ATP-binding protein [SAR324 cluster bacterium]|nr:ABC transporter ATP-binding protein [SAR324 cluster bacterium]
MSQPLLEVQQVFKNFGGFAALSGVNIYVNPGERLGLIGPNGSGKTTMINCISGLLTPEKGKIIFEGNDITQMTPHHRARAGIMRTFQIPKPFNSMTVVENLCIPLEYAAEHKTSLSVAEEEARKILTLIGIEALGDLKPTGLTQVDMRKMELARSLAGRPKLLILDEVMAGLSGSEVDEILEILFKLNEQGITIIMIEHVMRAVLGFSKRISVLNTGLNIAEGTPDEILNNPEVEKVYLGE